MIRQLFNKPSKFNTFTTRQVDPMELFWDLIFVVTLRYIIDAYVVNFSMFTFGVGIFVFIETYLFWSNINVYSVNFYDVSHDDRFLMTFMLSPLLIIASITDYTNVSSIYYLGISLILLKLMQAYCWSRAIKQHQVDNNNSTLNNMYQNEIRVYLLCALMSTALFIFPTYVIPILIVLIVTELYLPSILNRNSQISYNFDRVLIAERYLLFIILIFGEGFIGVVHIFQHSHSLTISELARGLVVFWTLYAMFLKLYDEYAIHKERVSTTFMIFLSSYVISSMLVISTLVILGLTEGVVTPAMSFVAIIAIIAYNSTYAYNAYRYLNKGKTNLLKEDVSYYKRDLVQSLIAMALSILGIVFISDTLVLLIVLSIVIIYSTRHIAIRAKIVENIFKEDHEIIEVNK